MIAKMDDLKYHVEKLKLLLDEPWPRRDTWHKDYATHMQFISDFWNRENAMNIKLPSTLYEHTLEDMKVGEQGWTVPWAMWVDADGTLWLNGRYAIRQAPGEPGQIQILRRPDGFHVDIRQCPKYRWRPGISWASPIPVVKLIQ